MKRLSAILLVVLLFVSIQSSGQSITPNMGKRLTYWCNSSDARMATVLSLLGELYPDSEHLLRKVDNFEYNVEDTKAVLLALYKKYGADWAYAGINDYFTSEQIAIIEQLYLASGGYIKKERTEEERERMSNLALQRGITIDMANRLSRYCYQDKNFQYFAIRILVGEGVSDMGCYRIIDNFSKNLDYVEDILLSCYEIQGKDYAYYILREFLTGNQIDILDGMYDNWQAAQIEKERQAESQRQKELQHKIDSVRNLEPFTLSDISNTNYNLIKKALFSEMQKCLKINRYKKDNYSIKIIDDLQVYPDKGTDHNLSITVDPQDERISDILKTTLESVQFSALSIKLEEFDYSLQVSYKDHFVIQYNYSTEETDMVVVYKKSGMELKEGDEEFFKSYYGKIFNAINDTIEKTGTRQKTYTIKVKKHFENGEYVSTEIIAL